MNSFWFWFMIVHHFYCFNFIFCTFNKWSQNVCVLEIFQYRRLQQNPLQTVRRIKADWMNFKPHAFCLTEVCFSFTRFIQHAIIYAMRKRDNYSVCRAFQCHIYMYCRIIRSIRLTTADDKSTCIAKNARELSFTPSKRMATNQSAHRIFWSHGLEYKYKLSCRWLILSQTNFHLTKLVLWWLFVDLKYFLFDRIEFEAIFWAFSNYNRFVITLLSIYFVVSIQSIKVLVDTHVCYFYTFAENIVQTVHYIKSYEFVSFTCSQDTFTSWKWNFDWFNSLANKFSASELVFFYFNKGYSRFNARTICINRLLILFCFHFA